MSGIERLPYGIQFNTTISGGAISNEEAAGRREQFHRDSLVYISNRIGYYAPFDFSAFEPGRDNEGLLDRYLHDEVAGVYSRARGLGRNTLSAAHAEYLGIEPSGVSGPSSEAEDNRHWARRLATAPFRRVARGMTDGGAVILGARIDVAQGGSEPSVSTTNHLGHLLDISDGIETFTVGHQSLAVNFAERMVESLTARRDIQAMLDDDVDAALAACGRVIGMDLRMLSADDLNNYIEDHNLLGLNRYDRHSIDRFLQIGALTAYSLIESPIFRPAVPMLGGVNGRNIYAVSSDPTSRTLSAKLLVSEDQLVSSGLFTDAEDIERPVDHRRPERIIGDIAAAVAVTLLRHQNEFPSDFAVTYDDLESTVNTLTSAHLNSSGQSAVLDKATDGSGVLDLRMIERFHDSGLYVGDIHPYSAYTELAEVEYIIEFESDEAAAERADELNRGHYHRYN